jgi:hypothetical protein
VIVIGALVLLAILAGVAMAGQTSRRKFYDDRLGEGWNMRAQLRPRYGDRERPGRPSR